VTVTRTPVRRRAAFVVGTLALSIAAGGVAGAVTGARDPVVDLQQAAPPAAAAQGSITAAAGQVVGVNTAIATLGTTRSGNIGIGFAIPVDRMTTIVKTLLD
jgi:putative serine protease PepD